ncbi:MAG: oxygen-independent coproporphyrinogen III oxidase [Alphaproteobacteria bacterium]|nr:oxygen-independent coproporphyrinogen III oxidase [Alphaproteobacteria bacterium]
MTDLDSLVRRYDARIPRYTSYPTAPHFRPVGEDRICAEWYAKLEGRLSLYLHVPFCARMCWYCGCHTQVVKTAEPVARYAGLLEREVEQAADRIGLRLPVSHVHFGGGTPNLLAPRDFAELMATIARRFSLAAGAEIAIEIDPRSLDEERIAAYRDAGVNRASLGVQTFDDRIQRAINRIQPFATVARAVERLRAAGIEALNFDLLYGLPGQSEADVVATVEQALELGPSRVALFGYAHVPWMKPHQARIDEAALPGPGQRLRQFLAAGERLERAGWRSIGLDHFALPEDELARAAAEGRLRRNFQGYTADAADALLGFGASSIGALPQGYVQNRVGVRDWEEGVAEGRLPHAKFLTLTDEDRLRREAIERLMCDRAVDLAAIAARHGVEPALFLADVERLGGMVEDGLVRIEGWRVVMTERGWPFLRAACAAFDAYLRPGEARHSAAV